MTSTVPRISVVVRSMNRLDALAELLKSLLLQDHDSFEVVVVEQTETGSAEALLALKPLFADPRVRVLRHRPLGGPAARNEGVRASYGDIIILIDDDDLPLGADWIRKHEAHYADENLVGLTGRHVREAGEASPYLSFLRPFIRRRCMSYSWLKTPYTFARFDEDVDGVEWLHGTNSSFRKRIVMKSGLWDTAVSTQDEHSMAFKLSRLLSPQQHLAFRTAPVVLRRLGLAGGMNKRRANLLSELMNHLRFVHITLGTAFPARVRWAYPAYLLWAMSRTAAWVWNGQQPQPSLWRRLGGLVKACALLPKAVVQVRRESRTDTR